MDKIEICFTSIALASDAFAVSISQGLGSKNALWKAGILCGFWFGFFQALMPLIGFAIGSVVSESIQKIAPYVAFALLSFIGGKTLTDVLKKPKGACTSEHTVSNFHPRTMFALALATSIDALAVGITFSALRVAVFYATTLIGCVTFFLCMLGVFIGRCVGVKCKTQAKAVGGGILLLIAIKILAEHLITLYCSF